MNSASLRERTASTRSPGMRIVERATCWNVGAAGRALDAWMVVRALGGARFYDQLPLIRPRGEPCSGIRGYEAVAGRSF